jgi:hypothetical protein
MESPSHDQGLSEQSDVEQMEDPPEMLHVVNPDNIDSSVTVPDEPAQTSEQTIDQPSDQPQHASVTSVSERVTIAGILVDLVGAIDPERVDKVTSGRRKIPLSMMFRAGGTDSASSAGVDHYIAVVCYDVVGNDAIKISSLIFTGSTEAMLTIQDPSDIPLGLSLDNIKGCCLLVLNPTATGPTTLRVPSLRACLKLGRLGGLSACSHDGCSKPVLVDRDGSLCYQHAVSTGVRATSGGTSVSFQSNIVSMEEEAKRRRERQAKAPSAEEKKVRELEQRRQELIAKKKTALMLLNRNHGAARTEAHVRLSTGSLGESMIDIGEVNMRANDDESRLARFEALKRKREAIDKKDIKKENKRIENIAKMQEVVKPKVSQPITNRKSLSQQLADQIKSERGY